jgi:hypothetical protein
MSLAEKKNAAGVRASLVDFAGFFEGGGKNLGGNGWFLRGDFVVRCVVEDGQKSTVFEARKIRQLFQLYFSTSF